MITGGMDTTIECRQKGEKPGGVSPENLIEDKPEEKTSDDIIKRIFDEIEVP